MISHFYRAFLFTDLKPLFSKFLGLISSQKIRSEPLPPDVTDLEALAKDINEQMGFESETTKLTASSFAPNPGLRKASKGKYPQICDKYTFLCWLISRCVQYCAWQVWTAVFDAKNCLCHIGRRTTRLFTRC